MGFCYMHTRIAASVSDVRCCSGLLLLAAVLWNFAGSVWSLSLLREETK